MTMPIRTLIATAFTIFAVQMASPEAAAQFGGDRIQRPLNRPTVSPYLNLFSRGNGRSPILNYYGAVRPQQQFFQQDQKLSKGLKQVEDRNQNNRNRWTNRNTGNDAFRRYRMGMTGHRTGFMTLSGGGGDQGGGGSGQEDDSSGGRSSGHSASFSRGNFGSREQ